MESSRAIILLYCSLFSSLVAVSIALDTISANQTIRDDDNGTILSAGGIFELGFFSPGSSKNRYLGIWYKNITNKTVVWVANRENPLSDSSGVLGINANGNLVLVDSTNGLVWSPNSSQSRMNLVAQLFDTGNFVIRDGNDSDLENYLWQSFDHPGDTILPGMKLGWDLVTGLDRYTSSWKNANDPSPGIYTSKVDRNGYPQLLVWEDTSLKFRFGPWDGIQFSGLTLSIVETTFDMKVVLNQKEIFISFEITSGSNALRLVLSPEGDVLFLRWSDRTQSWEKYLSAQSDECDRYALCGAYGSCNITQSRSRYGVCGCLEGYQPKYPKKWDTGNSSDGCVRKTQFDCGNGDAFVKYSSLKLPDTRHTWTDINMSLKECESMCLKNCSCTAYSNIDIREGGIGCMMWFDDLIDIRNYRATGLDLYVKINASELDAKRSSKPKRQRMFIAVAALVVLIGLLGLLLIYIFRKRMLRRKGILKLNPESDSGKANEREDLDLPVFDFTQIANATNDFSHTNKLGEGGFGPVYKGILEEGQEIAVKRLSKDSTQGLYEFKNEVSYIAKLRHRNLVRLLGCCIQEGEMLLIYEYMPNKSLDFFIFDRERSKLLDWPKRYNIINGVARGLLYLHQDSIVRIIHRDLKASNILLDYEMNPKISDFGMARSFGGSGRMKNTTKVVGTLGYMSPEYALDGIFSDKSDVYSFGVLLLETVSGKKMTGFYDPDPSHNLLGHAWRLYRNDKFSELVASSIIVESVDEFEVFRAIQIGLLCVQPYPEDRPSMSLVVVMLSSEIELPQPKQPGFFTERTPVHESDIHKLYHYSSSSESNRLVSPR